MRWQRRVDLQEDLDEGRDDGDEEGAGDRDGDRDGDGDGDGDGVQFRTVSGEPGGTCLIFVPPLHFLLVF